MTRKRVAPGSAPPIRDVTSAEVERHLSLVDFTLNRMMRSGQIAPGVEYEDLQAIGRWAVWEALRRWEPAKGAQATYLSSYIRGYVLKNVKRATRALGYFMLHGEYARHVQVGSYEATLVEDFTVLDTLAAVDDTEQAGMDRARVARVLRHVAGMDDRRRVIAEAILTGASLVAAAKRLGVSPQRVMQLAEVVRAELAEASTVTAPARTSGTLLVDRDLHRTEAAAIREAGRVHPGCLVLSARKMKLRKGRVVAPQGRPAADGSLGRPVWLLEVAL